MITLATSYLGVSATFTVTTLAGDNSVGSIRWACDQANATAGHDIVVFAAALGATPTITMNTNLFITESIEIQGYTALGGMVELIGMNGDCITMNSGNVGTTPQQTIFSHLNIHDFPNQGIFVENTENVLVEGCIIGTTIAGAPAPNQVGMFFSDCENITIGTAANGNVVSQNTNEASLLNQVNTIAITNFESYGNSKGIDLIDCSDISISNSFIGDCDFEGIHIKLSNQVEVQSSIIGLMVDGATAATNGGDGVKVEGSTNVTVGGASPLERNIISNSKNGVWIGGGDPTSGPRELSDGVNVYGNYVGTDVSGMVAHGNNDHQIRIDDAHNVNIGNSSPSQGNVIGGRAGFYGIYHESQGWWHASGAQNIVIQNNYIGVNQDGTNALANLGGVLIADPQNASFGAVQVLDNLISGNVNDGIEIRNVSVSTIIQGNVIGQNAAQTAAIPNGRDGIRLETASNTIIGGLGANEGNTISGNTSQGINLILTSTMTQIIGNTIEQNLNGVFITQSASNQNLISQNSFSCNTTKAINLNGSPAVGLGNSNKVTPTIFASSSVGNLTGTAGAGETVEIYERGDCFTNGTCSAMDYQMQGNTYIASVTANGAGEWSYAIANAPEEYTVTATSTSNNTSEFAICSCSNPTFTVTGTDPTTCGGTDGSIILTPSGGNPLEAIRTYDLSYNNPGSVGPTSVTTIGDRSYTITGLSMGTYTAITLEAFTCSTNGGNVSLSDPTPAVISTTSTNPTSCGSSDGTITIDGLVSGLSYDVSYELNALVVGPVSSNANASGQIILTGLEAGVYTDIFVSAFNCESNMESETLSDPSAPVISTTPANPSSCGSADGTITISGLTALTNYDISYNDGSAVGPLSLSSNNTGEIVISGLSEGAYNSIIADIAGCVSNSSSETLSDPAASVITTTFTNPTSCGGTEGTISINGLTPNETYDISYSDGAAVGPLALTSNSSGVIILTGLSQGNYTSIMATRAGCMSNLETETLVDPMTPVIGSTSTNPTTCMGSEGEISISGLTSGSTYNVTYENGGTVGPLTIIANGAGNVLVTGLSAGSYANIMVSLANCQSNTVSETLTDPSAPVITSSSTNPTTCIGTDGVITLNGLNTSTTYSVFYTNGSLTGPLSLTSNGSGVITVTGLGSGAYTDVMVSLMNCESNAVTETLSDPSAPVITTSEAGPTTCQGADGSITISGLASSTAFSVSYSNGTIVGPVSMTSTSGGDIVLSGLTAGSYTGVFVEFEGCRSNTSAEVLTDPSSPTITTSALNPTSCGGSEGTIEISGLTASTSYDVSYTLGGSTTSDAVSTNGIGVITLFGLTAGAYSSIIVEQFACPSNASSETLIDPTAPVITTSGFNPSTCTAADGSIAISGLVAGENYDVFYENNGSVGPVSIVANGSGVVSITGLVTGVYSSIHVVKSNCESNLETVTLVPPNAPTFTISTSNTLTCGGDEGELTISPSGVNPIEPNTTYVVSYVIDGSLPEVITSVMSNASGVLSITGLSAGEITNVEVDDQGCKSIDVGPFTIVDPQAPTFAIESVDPSNCGLEDGVIRLIPSGVSPLSSSTTYEVSYINALSQLVGPLSMTSDASAEILLSDLNEGEYSSFEVSLNSCATQVLDVLTLTSTVLNVGTTSISELEICSGTSVDLNLFNTNGERVVWQDSTSGATWEDVSPSLDASVPQITFSPSSSIEPIYYRASVTLGECVSQSNQVVLVVDTCPPPPPIMIPNAITPNGDNENDEWVIQGLSEYEGYFMRVFNRWGNVVFESYPPYTSWEGQMNGKDLPVATYYYVLDLFDTGEQLSGHVSIIR